MIPSQWRMLVFLISLLAGFFSPVIATSAAETSNDLVASFYNYTKYQPDSSYFTASPQAETPDYHVLRLIFPSQVISPSPNNNLVRGDYYQPKVIGKVPAVIVLHGWGAPLQGHLINRFCRSLAKRGMAAFMLELPYHLKRRGKDKLSGAGFLTSDPQRLVESGKQSVIDLRCVLDWLETRPEVNSQQLGVVGLSLGAMTANLAMGIDDRLKTGVSILGGGDLTKIVWRNPLMLPWTSKMKRAGVTESTLRTILHPVDPLTFAGHIPPRHMLMINGYYDWVIPPSTTQELVKALNNPPIIWLNSGHFSIVFAWDDIIETTCTFLQSEFEGNASWTPKAINANPVKLALLWDRHQGFRPGITKELLSSKGRGRFSLDLGLTTQGFFTGVNAALTDTLAFGIGTPIGKGRQKFTLYSAMQLVL